MLRKLCLEIQVKFQSLTSDQVFQINSIASSYMSATGKILLPDESDFWSVSPIDSEKYSLYVNVSGVPGSLENIELSSVLDDLQVLFQSNHDKFESVIDSVTTICMSVEDLLNHHAFSVLIHLIFALIQNLFPGLVLVIVFTHVVLITLKFLRSLVLLVLHLIMNKFIGLG